MPDQILSMPAASFFEFTFQMSEIQSSERIAELDIAMSSAMKFEYYDSLRKRYSSVYRKSETRKQPAAAMSWDDPRAKENIRRIFSEVRRSRYGR